MIFILFSSIMWLIPTQCRLRACFSSYCCSPSSPTATPSLGGGRPATRSFRQYLWPGLTTTTKLIKTPSAKRSALMKLHHMLLAWGCITSIRGVVIYHYWECSGTPICIFYNLITKRGDGIIIQNAESYKKWCISNVRRSVQMELNVL